MLEVKVALLVCSGNVGWRVFAGALLDRRVHWPGGAWRAKAHPEAGEQVAYSDGQNIDVGSTGTACSVLEQNVLRKTVGRESLSPPSITGSP